MAVYCLLALVVSAASLAAPLQEEPDRPTRTAVVTAVTEPIFLDGALDEPAWGSSPQIGALVQRIPMEGAEPSERTEVTLLRDEDNLYIGVMCHDSEPDRILASQMARDASVRPDDYVELLLDTFRDQSNAFYFSTNPNGALVDGLVFANGETNEDWDAIWNVATQRSDQGWSAEFAIPFKSLNFPPDGTVWGFNISRNIQRKFEEARWAGARFDAQFVQVSEAGEITGMGGLEQGLSLDIRPFVAGRWDRRAAGDDSLRGKPGLDLFYNVTPNLKLTATFNTDFGETEVDARQINLTRFSIFFPEKRSFFLQDAGVFNFATTGVSQPGGIPTTGAEIFPFFSRRIGLLGGREVPLDYGVKLTGRVGRTEVGVLNVGARDTSFVDEQSVFVGRVRRNFWQQSYVGALVTSGNPALSADAATMGVDLRLATSDILGSGRNFVFNAWGLESDNEGVADNDAAFGFAAAFPNDRYDAQVQWREIQENFDPALGFVQRRNVQMLRLGASFNPRPKNQRLGIQQMYHDIFYTEFTRLDNGLVESRDFYFTIVDWHFQSGDSLHSLFDVNPTYERLFEPFEISPGVVLPPGEYDFTPLRIFFTSAQKRRLQGSIGVTFGSFWSGDAETVSAGLRYSAPPRLTISVNTNQTFARLPQGEFVARIHRAEVNYAVSPRLSFANLVQFDNRSGNLGFQGRVRWTLEQGNDIFFIFGQGWVQELGDRGSDFRQQDSRLAVKAQYTFRL